MKEIVEYIWNMPAEDLLKAIGLILLGLVVFALVIQGIARISFERKLARLRREDKERDRKIRESIQRRAP